jgi:hypothetical protein
VSCQPDFARLSGELGFACDSDSFVTFRNPLTLTNWTLPVVESLMVLGAVLALWLAVRRLRRDGDPTTLTLWLASVVYLLIVEPPLYFPEAAGIADQVGTVFAHNVFTVEFLYDRLPLYIVALYPTVITLSYDAVRSVGVFERRGAVLGGMCVGFVNACFYEVFDHLGPQEQWWVWNTDNDLNHPMMNSVPMTSVVIFAMLAPASLAFLVYRLVSGPVARGRRFGVWAVAWRTLLIGALVPGAMVVLSLPATVFEGRPTVQAVVFGAAIVVFAVVSGPLLFQGWRRTRHEGGTEYPTSYVKFYGALYLAVFTVLWVSALPEFAGAIGGLTSIGTPTGNFGYVALCFTAALACVAGASTVGKRVPQASSGEVTTTPA